jgi:putative nucleotidyltransferase with HDIG domain
VTSPTPIRPADTRSAALARTADEGHGRRLTAAFAVVEAFPALAESRDRLLRLVAVPRGGSDDAVVAAIESDVALVIAVLRLANRADGPGGGRTESVRAAVEVLSPEAVHALAARQPTFDFFESSAAWDGAPERVRLHAVATQRAAERLAAETGYADRDRLMVTALLHDVGKLVLAHAYPGYPRTVHGTACTPDERVAAERLELGVDHAVVGGVLARRWGLPAVVAAVIERHHADDATGEAAFVRLADMLAHYAHGDPIDSTELLTCARRMGLSPSALRAVIFDLPSPVARPAPPAAPCPLSSREREVLERLSEGKVYKQIGADLGLSPSTVRSHLHNIYGKLGAADRAQAVLIAAGHGWLEGIGRPRP